MPGFFWFRRFLCFLDLFISVCAGESFLDVIIRRPRLGACSGGAAPGIPKVPSNGRRCASFLPGWSVAAMVFAAALSLSPWPCLGGSRACCEAVAAGLWLVCTALLSGFRRCR